MGLKTIDAITEATKTIFGCVHIFNVPQVIIAVITDKIFGESKMDSISCLIQLEMFWNERICEMN